MTDSIKDRLADALRNAVANLEHMATFEGVPDPIAAAKSDLAAKESARQESLIQSELDQLTTKQDFRNDQ